MNTHSTRAIGTVPASLLSIINSAGAHNATWFVCVSDTYMDEVFALLLMSGATRTAGVLTDRPNGWLLADHNAPSKTLKLYPNAIRQFYEQGGVFDNAY